MRLRYGIAILVMAGMVSGCAKGSGDPNAAGLNPLMAGNGAAQVVWQNGDQVSSEQIQLQLDSIPDPHGAQRTWTGIEVIHLYGAIPDSMTIETSYATIGGDELSEGPDHDHDNDHDETHGHGHGHAEQGAMIRIVSSDSGMGGASAAQLSSDQSDNVIIRARNLRRLVQEPGCGIHFIMEIDLRNARLSLPFEVDC